MRPQGRRGEILAEPLTDLAEVLRKNREVWLASPVTAQPSAGHAPLSIEDIWSPTGRNTGRVVRKRPDDGVRA